MTEVWKPVVGNTDYEVSNLGRVKRVAAVAWAIRPGVTVISKPAGQILKPKPGPRGYIMTTLMWPGYSRGVRTVQIHRLVAQAFIANPHNKPAVNHLNFDHADNRVDNLEWCSNKENSQHAYAAGRFSAPPPPRGVANKMSKLTDDDIKHIRQLCQAGVPRAEIARQFKIDSGNLSLIARGLAWKHVT